jgi:hypothetical protein
MVGLMTGMMNGMMTGIMKHGTQSESNKVGCCAKLTFHACHLFHNVS